MSRVMRISKDISNYHWEQRELPAELVFLFTDSLIKLHICLILTMRLGIRRQKMRLNYSFSYSLEVVENW